MGNSCKSLEAGREPTDSRSGGGERTVTLVAALLDIVFISPPSKVLNTTALHPSAYLDSVELLLHKIIPNVVATT